MAKSEHVVILVHGIRDHALWQESVRRTLGEYFAVESTNYGRFDLIRFLLPMRLFRRQVIARVWRQIRDIRRQYPNARLSFIAHSFGTYVLANVLLRNFDFTVHRIILCGSVLPYDFPFEEMSHRFTSPIVNEIGTRDMWPAVAESVTWGYGSAGTFGFRRPRIRDRWHEEADHGYFLNSEFCRKYWVPLLQDGTFVPGSPNPQPPRTWVQAINVVQLKYVGLFFAAAFTLACYLLLAGMVCMPYSPETDKRAWFAWPRYCHPGQTTYVKWNDGSKYPAAIDAKGEFPSYAANRSFAVVGADDTNAVTWSEQNLLFATFLGDKWSSRNGSWRQLSDNFKAPGGRLLRRGSTLGPCSEPVEVLEAYLPPGIFEELQANRRVDMCYRWVRLSCFQWRNQEPPSIDPPFNLCVGKILKAGKD